MAGKVKSKGFISLFRNTINRQMIDVQKVEGN